MSALVHEVPGAFDDLQPQHKIAAFFDAYSGCSSAQARHVQHCSAQCNACSQQNGVTSSAWQRVRTAQELLGALEDCCRLLTCRICVAVLCLKALRTLCISFFGTRSHVSQNFAGQCLTLSRALAPLRSAIRMPGLHGRCALGHQRQQSSSTCTVRSGSWNQHCRQVQHTRRRNKAGRRWHPLPSLYATLHKDIALDNQQLQQHGLLVTGVLPGRQNDLQVGSVNLSVQV